MKYWIGFKVLSLLLDFFARRNDNKLTQGTADFLRDTLDKTRPTDYTLVDRIEGEIQVRKKENL